MVPIVPGLVRLTLAPLKSSGVSLLARTRRSRSSYAPTKVAKSSVSALRSTGTTRLRWPPAFSTSTATQRFTRSWRVTSGVASGAVECTLPMLGTASAIARTTAHAMRWVKLTLLAPERPR